MSNNPRSSHSGVFFWLICACFLAFYLIYLDELPHNIDEGVNILNARSLRMGKSPYLDFFYHQLPFHLYLLSFVSWISPDSLFLHRLPSLLAIAATGGIVYRIACRLMPAPAAAGSVVLYYAAPLQYHGLLAMPNGLMMLFSTLSIYMIVFHDGKWPVALGAVSLVLAILLKPLALATACVIALLLLLQPQQRWKLMPLMLIVAVGGTLSWLVLHRVSEGVFTEMLGLQRHRYTHKTGFWMLYFFTGFREVLEELNIHSFLSWNIYSHSSAFFNVNFAILVTALGGGWVAWRTGGSFPGQAKLLLVLWIVIPCLFSLFVWEPSWAHHHIQYLPAFSLLGALFLQRIWNATKWRRLSRGFIILWVALNIGLGVASTLLRSTSYSHLKELRRESETLLSFDPFLTFVTQTQPACGLTDPVAQTSVRFFRGEEHFAGFIRTQQMLIQCLEGSPDVKILISASKPWGLWFIKEELWRYLRGQEPSRIIYLGDHDESAFQALFSK